MHCLLSRDCVIIWNMKNIQVACLVGVVAVCSGCDFFGSEAKKVEIIRLEQQQAVRVASEKKDAEAALKAYIEGRYRLVADEHATVTAKLAELTNDVARLESAMAAAAATSNGEELSFEVRLLRILKSETVGAMAQKYLSTGFSVQREAFVAKVREARAAEKEYLDAVSKCLSAFDAKVGDSTGWVTTSKDQRDAEVSRLRREIAELERQRTVVRRALVGSKNQERERKEKIDDFDIEIKRKRRQIDDIRNPDASRRVEANAAMERQFAHDRANEAKRLELRDIDRRLKPKITVMDVATKVEAETLGALRKALDDRRCALSGREQDLSGKLRLAKELQLEVSVSDMAGLQNLKLRATKELSLDTLK